MIYDLFLYGDWAMLALRVVIGIIFLVHGWPKLKDIKGTAGWLGSEGFKPGIFWAVVIAILEVFGGLGLILGIYVQVLAALFAVQMFTGTIWKMKKGMKLVNGYEIDLALLAGALVLLTLGPGTYALL